MERPSRKELQRIHRRMGTGANLDGSRAHDCYDDQRRPSEVNNAELDAKWDLAFGRITQEEYNKLKENNYGV